MGMYWFHLLPGFYLSPVDLVIRDQMDRDLHEIIEQLLELWVYFDTQRWEDDGGACV